MVDTEDRGQNAERRLVITDAGYALLARLHLIEQHRQAMQACFGRPWPTVAQAHGRGVSATRPPGVGD